MTCPTCQRSDCAHLVRVLADHLTTAPTERHRPTMDTARIARAAAAIQALPEQLRLVTDADSMVAAPATLTQLATIAERVLEVLDDNRHGLTTKALDELVTLAHTDQLAGLTYLGDYPPRRQLRTILDVVAEADA